MTDDRPESEPGIVTKLSPRPVADAVARLTAMITARGLKLFAVIDHAAEARRARGYRDRLAVLTAAGRAGHGSPTRFEGVECLAGC